MKVVDKINLETEWNKTSENERKKGKFKYLGRILSFSLQGYPSLSYLGFRVVPSSTFTISHCYTRPSLSASLSSLSQRNTGIE